MQSRVGGTLGDHGIAQSVSRARKYVRESMKICAYIWLFRQLAVVESFSTAPTYDAVLDRTQGWGC